MRDYDPRSDLDGCQQNKAEAERRDAFPPAPESRSREIFDAGFAPAAPAPQVNEPSEDDLEHDRRLTVAEAELDAANDSAPAPQGDFSAGVAACVEKAKVMAMPRGLSESGEEIVRHFKQRIVAHLESITDSMPKRCLKCGHAGMLTAGQICTYNCTPDSAASPAAQQEVDSGE